MDSKTNHVLGQAQPLSLTKNWRYLTFILSAETFIVTPGKTKSISLGLSKREQAKEIYKKKILRTLTNNKKSKPKLKSYFFKQCTHVCFSDFCSFPTTTNQFLRASFFNFFNYINYCYDHGANWKSHTFNIFWFYNFHMAYFLANSFSLALIWNCVTGNILMLVQYSYIYFTSHFSSFWSSSIPEKKNLTL